MDVAHTFPHSNILGYIKNSDCLNKNVCWSATFITMSLPFFDLKNTTDNGYNKQTYINRKWNTVSYEMTRSMQTILFWWGEGLKLIPAVHSHKRKNIKTIRKLNCTEVQPPTYCWNLQVHERPYTKCLWLHVLIVQTPNLAW